MLFKVLCLFIIASIVSSGHGAQEFRLPDRHVHHISHSHLGAAISIPQDLFDTLVHCYVIFPNGTPFEVFPNFQVNHPNVFLLRTSFPPYVGCGFGFRDVGVEFSGVYELLSTVQHRSDRSMSLTRGRFNITVSLMSTADDTLEQ